MGDTMTASSDEAAEAAAGRDALVERLFQATLGAWDVLTVYLGDRLGLYRSWPAGPDEHG